MRQIAINILTLTILAIVTPLVLLLWVIYKGFCLVTKNIKVESSDFWGIVDSWDDWIYEKLKESFDQ